MIKEIIRSGILVACALSCTSQHANEQLKKMDAKEKTIGHDTLALVISPAYNSDIAYGSMFSCKVMGVNKGRLEQDSIPLLAIKQEYMDYLMAHAVPGTCVVTFVKKQEQVKENRLSIDGFIDKNKVAWEIVKIR